MLDGVDLTRAEAAALNASQLVSVQPRPDGWRVTAAYAVGAVRCGVLTVRVFQGPLWLKSYEFEACTSAAATLSLPGQLPWKWLRA